MTNEMSQQPTKSVLYAWRFGSTVSEKLCAEILHIDGVMRKEEPCTSKAFESKISAT